MNALRLMAAGLLLLGLTAVVPAEGKKADLKDKLAGSWIVVKAAEGSLPIDTVVTFTKEGKMKVVGKREGKEVSMEGTYTTEAHKFSFVLKAGENEYKKTITVKKITDDELSTADAEGKGVEFKRKK